MRSRAGQAMIELAVFGTFMLFGLALLVRFGLQQYHSLQTQQEAFRLALKEAYETRAYNGQPSSRPPAGTERPALSPGNASQVLLVRDVYIPDPTNPFGTGSHIASPSSATVQWGTDGTEFSPKDDAALGKTVFQINDRREVMHNARFHDEGTFAYGGVLPNRLCAYYRAYGTNPVVEVLASDGSVIEADIGYNFCDLGGAAIIQLKQVGGRTPVAVRVRLIDSCRADIISAVTCKDQCDKIATEALLTPPAYCSLPPISPFDDTKGQGLDLLNSVSTHHANNQLHLTESAIGTQSTTIINESTINARMIKTNRHVQPADIDVSTTTTRQREKTWSTPW